MRSTQSGINGRRLSPRSLTTSVIFQHLVEKRAITTSNSTFTATHDLDLRDKWSAKNVFQVNYAKGLLLAHTRIAHDPQAKRWDKVDSDLNTQIVPE